MNYDALMHGWEIFFQTKLLLRSFGTSLCQTVCKIISQPLSIFIFAILLSLLPFSLYAKDFGVLGETYPIMENDFLSVLEKRVTEATANGRLVTAEDSWKRQAENYRNRPTPVQGLTLAGQSNTFYFDPSMTLARDIIAPNGLLIAKAGTVINPLKVIPLTETLIFLNADDQKEIAWCQQELKKIKKTKIILVQGAILPTEKILKQPIYFDQHGTLTQHFHITHIPATIQQAGLMLRIDEVKV